ncbi:MAG: hypothetical protein IT198_05280 [Acidimicrobiia bacterium]|nr:hypothetical protein [Acidimicrobiia bacterium]
MQLLSPTAGTHEREIAVAISVRDDRLAREAAAVISRCRGMRIESDRPHPACWPAADVALVDREVDAPMPTIRVTGAVVAGDLESAVRDALAAGDEEVRGGTVAAVWSAKGGCGATVFAVNLAGAVNHHGLRSAYADLDHVWQDGASWFGAPDEVLSRDCRLARTHASGLRGFMAAGADDRAVIAAGVRAGFDFAVLDLPSGHVPRADDLADSDLLFLLVPCDLAGLERTRRALGELPAALPVHAVAVERPGSKVRPDDVDEVLGLDTEAVLVHEPCVADWTDRGRLVFPYRRSRWAREVRALAASLADLLGFEVRG